MRIEHLPTDHSQRWEKDVPSAIQYVVLSSGGCEDVFTGQIRVLNHIKAFICTKLGASVDMEELSGNSVFIQRRVFTKVRHS